MTKRNLISCSLLDYTIEKFPLRYGDANLTVCLTYIQQMLLMSKGGCCVALTNGSLVDIFFSSSISHCCFFAHAIVTFAYLKPYIEFLPLFSIDE